MAIEPVVPQTPAAPVTPVVEDSYDTMSDVFDGLIDADAALGATNEDGSPVTTEVDKAAADAKADPAAPAAEPAAPAAAEPAAAEPSAAEPAKVEPPAEDWKAKFDALQAERAEPPAAAKPEPTQVEPAAETPVYSEDEATFLKEYDKDWPDIIKGEALKRRGEYRALVNHIFKEIVTTYGPLIERGAAAADSVAETTALSVIQGVHPDYDDKMYDDVHAWAETLTGTRRKIAQGIIEEGAPAEVAELITEFKSATGRKPKIVAGTDTAAPAAPVKTELSAKAKQAARAMSVVDSKRTTPITAADPSDFDSGWDDAVGGK